MYITSSVYRQYCHMTVTCCLQARERGLLAQVSETTAEKHHLEDTICRLKSEGIASAASLKEALEQLEKEKETMVCVASCDMSCDVLWPVSLPFRLL